MMPKMPSHKNGTKYVAKTITIRSDQEEFIKKNSISLSRFVQQKLDEIIGASKGK